MRRRGSRDGWTTPRRSDVAASTRSPARLFDHGRAGGDQVVSRECAAPAEVARVWRVGVSVTGRVAVVTPDMEPTTREAVP